MPLATLFEEYAQRRMYESSLQTWRKKCPDIGHDLQDQSDAGPMPGLVKTMWWHLHTSCCFIQPICEVQNV
jgi:hypothetical protein